MRTRSPAFFSVAAALVAALVSACASTTGPRVQVALQTDLVSVVEFRFVEISLSTPDHQVQRHARFDVTPEARFATPQDIARLQSIPPGLYELDVLLLDRSARRVATRHFDLDLQADIRVVARFDRGCRGVVCEEPNACAGSRCVPLDCLEEDTTCAMATECVRDSDCPAPAPCARAACLIGICYAFPGAECPSGSYCDPEQGCTRYAGEICGEPCLRGECAVGHWECGPTGPRCEGFLLRNAGAPCTDGFCNGLGQCVPCGPGCDAGGSDAGVPDAPATCLGGCDDSNPCTVDRCASGACTHTPDDGALCPDDGLFCNGSERCLASVCAHGGAPCPSCEEATDSCGSCSPMMPCPPDIVGAWTPCDYTSECATSGTRTRSVDSFTCTSGSCAGSRRMESEACGARSTEGNSCGEGTTTGPYTACSYSDICSNSGSRQRDVTTNTCRSGSCSSSEIRETDGAGCARDTSGTRCPDDGNFCNGLEVCAGGSCSAHIDAPCPGLCIEASASCGSCSGSGMCAPTSYGPWSSCSYGTTCSTSGTRSRDVTMFNCNAGSCDSSTSTENDSAGCARGTNGLSCGGVSYTGWSSCGGFVGDCDETGIRTRTRTDPTCSGGSCNGVDTTESEACSRSTGGTSCGATSCGEFGGCGGFDDMCDETGTQSQNCVAPTCGGGSCNPNPYTNTQGCTRSTGGTSCGATTFGAYGPCWDPFACSPAGIEERSMTEYRCAAGACASFPGTDSRACFRGSQDGAVCWTSVRCGDAHCSGGLCSEPECNVECPSMGGICSETPGVCDCNA